MIGAMLAVCSFILFSLPTAWSLFYSEPFVPWLVKRHLHLGFSPFYITTPIGGGLLIIILWALFSGRHKAVPVLKVAKIEGEEPNETTELKKQKQVEQDLRIDLTPHRWASPAVATVINQNRDYPAHIKTATLYGIKPDGTKHRIVEAWKYKFQDCVILPYSLSPDRQARLAFAGHLPYESFSELFVELELENRNTVIGSTIPAPRPTKKERSPAVTKVINEALRMIRENQIQFTLYALQKAGVGDLDSEEEFSDVREAIIQRGLGDPLAGCWITVEEPKWLDFIKFANRKGVQLLSVSAVLDCLEDYYLNGESKQP